MTCSGCQRRKALAKKAALAAWRKSKAQILGPWQPKAKKREAK